MTIVNNSVNPNNFMPQDLEYFIGLLDRKFSGRALLEIKDEGKPQDAEKRSAGGVCVELFRNGDYCGTVRQAGAVLLIKNYSIIKERVSAYQYPNEISTTKFGVGKDNSAALKLAVNNLLPTTMKKAFDQLATKISTQYQDILAKLRTDLMMESNKLMGGLVKQKAAALGLGSYYNHYSETYVLTSLFAEKIVAGDKEGLFELVGSLFNNNVSDADDYFYKFEKLAQYERGRTKDYGTQKFYAEELRDNSIRVINVVEMYNLLAAIKVDNAGNGHDPKHGDKTFWGDESRRYAARYPNLQEVPESLFKSIATLKAAGEKHYIHGVGVMMDEKSWLVEVE
jgi:hypothetical protein